MTSDPLMSRRAFAGSSAAALGLVTAGGRMRAPAAPAVAAGRPPPTNRLPTNRLPTNPLPANPQVTNPQVTNDGFAAHIEPAVAANPRDPRNLLAACRVFQADQIGMATQVSFDDGRHWRDNGLLPGLVPDFDGNAVVAFDARGHGFVCGIVATAEQPRHGDARIWRTDDGGRSFRPAVTAIAAGVGLADHPGLAIDRWAAAGPGRLYLVAGLSGAPRNGLVFCRSADGGRTFEQPRFIDPVSGPNAIAPVLAAGPGGTVCAGYLVPAGGAAVLTVLSSTDHGETFGAPVSLASIASLAPGLGNVTAKSGPAIAAAPCSGYLYAAVTSFDETAISSQILLFASPDRGRTWSAPVSVAASTTQIYLQPQLAVDAAGRVGLSAYALSIEDLRIDVLLYLSGPGAPRFTAPRRVTTQSFDPTLAIDTGSTRWLGNYQGLTTAGGAFHPIWTDTRTGNAQVFTATVPADDPVT
jgi:hypothetical protein